MSTDGKRTKWRRNNAENFNRMCRVHERYRRQTNGRQHIANVNAGAGGASKRRMLKARRINGFTYLLTYLIWNVNRRGSNGLGWNGLPFRTDLIYLHCVLSHYVASDL